MSTLCENNKLLNIMEGVFTFFSELLHTLKLKVCLLTNFKQNSNPVFTARLNHSALCIYLLKLSLAHAIGILKS